MQLAITGATGTVGRQLVPLLSAEGFDVLPVGRQRGPLQAAFPNRTVAVYSEMARSLRGGAVLHLAAVNNDAGADEAEFQRVNVDFLQDVLAEAGAGGAETFILMSSAHAMKPQADAYGRSKRRAEDVLRGNDLPRRVVLRPPAIYGQKLSGRLAVLRPVPAPLRNLLLGTLGRMGLPVVSVRTLAAAIASLLREPELRPDSVPFSATEWRGGAA